MASALEGLEAFMEGLMFPVSNEKPNETKHNAVTPVSKSTSKPANPAKREVIQLQKGPSKKSTPSQLQVHQRGNVTNNRKPFIVQRTRGSCSMSEEKRAKHNQRLMLRLDSERGLQTYTEMAIKQQAVDHKKTREIRQGHRVLKEMNRKLVQCNNKNKRVKVIFVEYDDSTISSDDDGLDDESNASGSYYTSDLSYLNDKFDQWLDRIAGIPDKRKRRSKY